LLKSVHIYRSYRQNEPGGPFFGPHDFWGKWSRDPGVGTMTFELDLDFLTMHLPTKFHHHTFNRSEVIMLTNKQTKRFCWKHPPRSAMLRQWKKSL